MKPSPTDIIYRISQIAAVVDALATEGVAWSDALAGTQLDAQELKSPETRASLDQIIQCYHNARRLSGDPHFAYHTGLRFHLSTYGLYGFAILCSTDFRQTMRFAEQYHQLATPDADVAFSEEADSVTWTTRPTPMLGVDAATYRFIVELQFGIGVSLHREAMGPAFVPLELRVTYGSGETENALENAVGCPVLFNQPENTWAFDKRWLDGPATLGNELAFKETRKLCDELMTEMQLRIGLAGSVREVLLVNLSQPMNLDAVSRRLKIAARTLKRKLREEGTSYRQIVDDLRTQLAIRYLRDTELTIEDIASVLGFADAASFRHSFQRWTKETFGGFRRNIGKSRRLAN